MSGGATEDGGVQTEVALEAESRLAARGPRPKQLFPSAPLPNHGNGPVPSATAARRELPPASPNGTGSLGSVQEGTWPRGGPRGLRKASVLPLLFCMQATSPTTWVGCVVSEAPRGTRWSGCGVRFCGVLGWWPGSHHPAQSLRRTGVARGHGRRAALPLLEHP